MAILIVEGVRSRVLKRLNEFYFCDGYAISNVPPYFTYAL